MTVESKLQHWGFLSITENFFVDILDSTVSVCVSMRFSGLISLGMGNCKYYNIIQNGQLTASLSVHFFPSKYWEKPKWVIFLKVHTQVVQICLL